VAAWMASGLFDEPSRTTIRLQLPRKPVRDEEGHIDLSNQLSRSQAMKLVGYARSAMGLS
jgi:hypothetical protein